MRRHPASAIEIEQLLSIVVILALVFWALSGMPTS